MTTYNAAKHILAYFNLECTDARVKKIESVIQDVIDDIPEKYIVKIKEVEKPVVKTKLIYVPSSEEKCRKIDESTVATILYNIAVFVCNKYGISIEQLKRDSSPFIYKVCPVRTHDGRRLCRRSNYFVQARSEFAKLVRQDYYETISLKMIANYLGYRDHTSIVHLINGMKVENTHLPLLEKLG